MQSKIASGSVVAGRLVLAAVAVLLSVAGPQGRAAAADGPQGGVLKVCADPNNLPFSNKQGQGFENKLAAMIAASLKLSLSYVWFPEARSSMPTPMSSRDCDLVMGYAQGTEFIEDSNPYYYTSYVIIYRRDDPALEGLTHLSDPRLKHARIGVTATTPPASMLAINGLGDAEVSFTPRAEAGAASPAREMLDQLESGKLDAVIMWGPIGGYYAKSAGKPLRVVPLVNEAVGPAGIYGITMGVKPDQPQWKHELNRFIVDNQADIDALLLSYDVPLLTPDGDIIKSAAAGQ